MNFANRIAFTRTRVDMPDVSANHHHFTYQSKLPDFCDLPINQFLQNRKETDVPLNGALLGLDCGGHVMGVTASEVLNWNVRHSTLVHDSEAHCYCRIGYFPSSIIIPEPSPRLPAVSFVGHSSRSLRAQATT